MASATEQVASDRALAKDPDLTIALDPHRPGAARARLVAYGVPVWAVIGYLHDDIDDEEAIRAVAEGFRIPEAAVRAAVDYYLEHRAVIDDLLEANSAITWAD